MKTAPKKEEEEEKRLTLYYNTNILSFVYVYVCVCIWEERVKVIKSQPCVCVLTERGGETSHGVTNYRRRRWTPFCVPGHNRPLATGRVCVCVGSRMIING